jgi:NADP-dependent 3-hydroxy acid dehydrogenase YdfG
MHKYSPRWQEWVHRTPGGSRRLCAPLPARIVAAMTDRLLSNRIAVVTGGSSGIGAATARRLAAAGAHVALVGRRTHRLKELAAALDGRALPLPVDVGDRAALDRAAQHVEEELGRVDLVVAGAGIMPISPIVERRADDWDRLLELGLGGVLNTVHAFVPQLVRAAEAGQPADLVTISSIAAHRVLPSAIVYGATKAGVTHLAAGLRAELGPLGVRVTNVEPGATDTELINSVGGPETRARIAEMLSGLTVLKPDDVARLVAFAVSQPPHVNLPRVVVMSSEEA